MSDRIKNIEEMTNKVVEYIHVTSSDTDDYHFQCMGAAAKFLLASFSFDRGVCLSEEQILDRCVDLANMIISIGQK